MGSCVELFPLCLCLFWHLGEILETCKQIYIQGVFLVGDNCIYQSRRILLNIDQNLMKQKRFEREGFTL